MDCIDDNTAVEFLEGTLSADAASAVERHSARCDGCRMLIAELARAPSLAEQTDSAMSPTIPAGGGAHIDLALGQTVGRFLVIGRIGSGGMGVVFAAYDPRLDRKVALKLLHGARPGEPPEAAQTRLLREAQAIAQLSHPNVISVYDVGTYKSEVYIAMEFVEGDTLTSWLRRWDRPWDAILRKFLDAGRALVEAHAVGLCHRDFKPDNVLVGNDERVRVMDFGLARSMFSDVTPPHRASSQDDLPRLHPKAVSALNDTLTQTGTVLGTPRYMAPEQLLGLAADSRADQFSYCVALYEALHGQHPFEGETAAALAEAPTGLPPRPPPAGTRVPGWLNAALVRGLSREPRARFPSMSALLEAIAPRAARPRQWLPVAAALACALLLLSGYVVWARATAPATIQAAQSEYQELAWQLGEYRRKAQQMRAQIADLEERNRALEAAHTATRAELVTMRELATSLERTLETSEQIIVELEARLERRRPAARAGGRGGGLSGVLVAELIESQRRDIEDCFFEWREREPGGTHTLALRFEVAPDGAVRILKPGGLTDRVVRECISGALQRIRFPQRPVVTTIEAGFRSDGPRVAIAPRVRATRPPEEPVAAIPETPTDFRARTLR